jgi:hypothetical protein
VITPKQCSEKPARRWLTNEESILANYKKRRKNMTSTKIMIAAEEPEDKSNVIHIVDTLNEKVFFDSDSKGRFIPKKLGDYIMKENHFRFAGEKLWVYRDGVYRPDGVVVTTQRGAKLLGNC